MIVNVYCMPRVSFAFEIINVNLKIIFTRLRIYDFNGDLAWLGWLGLGIEIGRSWQSNSQSMLWQPFSSMFSTPLSHIVNMARNRWCHAANGVLATSIHIIAMATFHVLSTPLRPAPFLLAAACLRAAFGCGTNGRAAFRLCPRCTRSDNIFFFFFVSFFLLLFGIYNAACQGAAWLRRQREKGSGREGCLFGGVLPLPLPLPLHMQWGPALIKCFHVACFHFDVRHFEFLSLLRECNTCVCVCVWAKELFIVAPLH